LAGQTGHDGSLVASVQAAEPAENDEASFLVVLLANLRGKIADRRAFMVIVKVPVDDKRG
jgi:hypothetical protein